MKEDSLNLNAADKQQMELMRKARKKDGSIDWVKLQKLLGREGGLQNTLPAFADWEKPKGLVLVYPKNLYKRTTLCHFYNEFLKVILNSAPISELVLVVRPNAKTTLEGFVKSLTSSIKVSYLSFSEVQDIWVRDYAPIYYRSGAVFKASYRPSYFEEKDLPYAEKDDKVGWEIARELSLNIKELRPQQSGNLVLDGGNFITNGNGAALITNRVIADNESLSIDEIRSVFQTRLGISNLIIVPVEPEDSTGHIDGMVRFIDKETVLVADYAKDYLLGKRFLDSIGNTLAEHFKVVRIENEIPKKRAEADELDSAFGNYINFLRLGNQVYLPQYGIKRLDAKAVETFTKNFPALNVAPINIDTEKLADKGGVLNCISWVYY